MAKALIIGLDGSTFDIIDPLLKKGKLPNISNLLDKGAHGILKSTVPPVTPVAWASFMTGVNPGKHGIFDFIEQKTGSYDLTWSKMSSRYRTLWSMVSDAGKKAIVVNVPMTYPPEKINGIMISGMGTPGADSDFVHPKKLRDTIDGFGEYKVDIVGSPDDPNSYFKETMELTVQHAAISKHLMKNYEWDLFMVVFIGTDRLQHNMWKYMDKSHPDYKSDDARKYGDLIYNFYQEIDSIIGDLIKNIDEETCVFIVSDHGFGPLHKRVHINKWLSQQGLFETGAKDTIENRSVRYRVSNDASGKLVPDDLIMLEARKPDRYAMAAVTRTLDPSKQHLIKVTARGSADGVAVEFNDFSNQANPIIGGFSITTAFRDYSTVFTPVKKKTTIGVGITSYGGNPTGSIFVRDISLRELDWSKIKAYTFGVSDHIHINLEGREPQGCVSKGKYEDRRNDIIEGLYALKDGSKVVDMVFKREELYHGAMLESAPDLTFVMKNYSYRSYNSFDLEGRLFEKPLLGQSGDHRIGGILIASGKGIKKTFLQEAEIIDIVPTVLGTLGIPIPKNIDGRVLEDMFKEDALKKMTFADETTPHGRRDEDQTAAKSREDRQVIDRLKRLGYLE